ncbi:Crp/Fnr family transcriptional regulator [Hymenobacter sp. 15J16-1T3B]|uniref:Crp/Fnr family transcriptional regulator n=1 Tax=Hymenobacter sp. 15J16-1T3B TaxID=2886941 RepID=UPI001D106010|nr:Crp/Fnr family transcriptional regulator [Hymenobacter sp. 15J16-1T3B]MCC3157864.1 Crp/Fnr family transcriptional regulator [Hymenobacter sp. 15J16-1T3B]
MSELRIDALMTDLLTYLQTIQPLSEGLMQALQTGITREELPEKHLLLQPGRVARKIYFVESGLVHGFTLFRERKVSSWFMREGDFVISVVSFLMQAPSTEYLELLEPSVVYSVTYDQLQLLYTHFPEFNTIGRRLTEKYYVLSEQRAYTLRTASASERYEQLLRDFPDIFQRVQVKQIASYLGIAPETLSRLRAQY